MGDLKKLPFRDSFADFLFCLGVIHHLPTYARDEVRSLKKYAPTLLIYLYHALDNRPFYFRILLGLVTPIRALVSKIRNQYFRKLFVEITAVAVHLPLVYVGKILKGLGLSHMVPLSDGYDGKSIHRIQQDVYDRFFTRIEQRFTKAQILGLENTFDKITVSENLPYWHFKCESSLDSG